MGLSVAIIEEWFKRFRTKYFLEVTASVFV